MHLIWQKFKEYYGLDKGNVALLAVIFTFTILNMLMMNTMANISSFWSIDTEDVDNLPDVIHEFGNPEKARTEFYLVELIDIIMGALSFLTFGAILLNRSALRIVIRVLIVMSLSYAFRINLVSITNLAPPEKNCMKIVTNFFTNFNSNRCGDLMFSGHTIIITLQFCIWSTYNLLGYFFGKIADITGSILISSVCVIEFFLIVFSRNHYLIDVLVSIYVTSSVWIIYGYLWHEHLRHENIFDTLNKNT